MLQIFMTSKELLLKQKIQGKLLPFTQPVNITEDVDKKNQLDVTFLFFISLLLVVLHVSGNHVPIIRS
jgi:hypothetical protein